VTWLLIVGSWSTASTSGRAWRYSLSCLNFPEHIGQWSYRGHECDSKLVYPIKHHSEATTHPLFLKIFCLNNLSIVTLYNGATDILLNSVSVRTSRSDHALIQKLNKASWRAYYNTDSEPVMDGKYESLKLNSYTWNEQRVCSCRYNSLFLATLGQICPNLHPHIQPISGPAN
jgi:hypothetical protein